MAYHKKHIHSLVKRSLLAVSALVMLLGFASPVYANDTGNYPWIRPDNWLSQIISSPSGGIGAGHINVDLLLAKNGQTYNPCQNSSDTFYAACDDGVYKTMRWRANGTSDFPFGIFVDNTNNNKNHFWARRVDAVFMEVYPYSVPETGAGSGYRLDPGACNCTVYGGFQVIINDWKGGYSANVGTLSPTKLTDSDAGRVAGFIKRNGVKVGANDVNIDWFGQDSASSHSSGGYNRVYSFASWPTNSDGYYTSGPVVKGNYHFYVLDRVGSKKVECFGINTQGIHDRMDMELTSQHFGLDAPGRQCYDRAP